MGIFTLELNNWENYYHTVTELLHISVTGKTNVNYSVSQTRPWGTMLSTILFAVINEYS